MAVTANLPLVKVEYEDSLYAHQVLQEVLGCTIKDLSREFKSSGFNIKSLGSNEVCMCFRPSPSWSWTGLYKHMANVGGTMIVISPSRDSSVFYDAGELEVPGSMIESMLVKFGFQGDARAGTKLLIGETMKSATEMAMLAKMHRGSLNFDTLVDICRMGYNSDTSLEMVDTDIMYYDPCETVEQWLKVDGELFKSGSTPDHLVPKGLLFSGDPGTGKTLTAKHLANELKVPLYLLSMENVLGKYVGQSNTQFKRALTKARSCSPCILLIDEVEKVFNKSSGGDSGVSRQLLSQLLWFLQEGRERVLVLMTTNSTSSIPPELVRPGRLDSHVHFPAYSVESSRPFLKGVCSALGIEDAVDGLMGKVMEDMTGAELHSLALGEAKAREVRKLKLKPVSKVA